MKTRALLIRMKVVMVILMTKRIIIKIQEHEFHSTYINSCKHETAFKISGCV